MTPDWKTVNVIPLPRGITVTMVSADTDRHVTEHVVALLHQKLETPDEFGRQERLVVGVLDYTSGVVHSITDHGVDEDPLSFVRIDPPTATVLS